MGDSEKWTLNPAEGTFASPPPHIAASLETDSEPIAVLPMRLNADALSDLVILRNGQNAPTVALTAPAATFTVNSTLDGLFLGDGDVSDGICDTGNATIG